MDQQQEFEHIWKNRLQAAIDQQGISHASIMIDQTSTDPLAWTCQLMDQLIETHGEETSKKIMLDCACQYPKEMLTEARENYHQFQDIDQVIDILKKQFIDFLETTLELSSSLIDTILKRGWGLAGVRNGNIITATKIPKSGQLKTYFECKDDKKKKALYCHCPRVQKIFNTDLKLSSTYCYCGAGFYKGLWEEILQQDVEIKVVQSIIRGDDVCQFEIYLPRS